MADRSTSTVPLLPTTERQLLWRLAEAQAVGRVPSLAATVVRDGQDVWSMGRGTKCPADQTQYRIGSITKTFTAVLVLQLRDQGELGLSDLVDAHIPGLGLGQVTIRQLLSHQSGLHAEPDGDWWERSPGRPWTELAGQFSQESGSSMALETGRRFHYSNLGYGILGQLIERLFEESWCEVVRRRILAPLEMRHTDYLPREPYAQGYSVHPYAPLLIKESAQETGAMAPAGQLWSTTVDLGRWAAFFADPVTEVLHPDSLEEMSQPAGVEDLSAWETAYGLGVELVRSDGKILVGHSGSMPGFMAAMFVDPDSRVGAAVAANATYGIDGVGICSALIGDVRRAEPPIPKAWAAEESIDKDLLELLGVWYWGHTPHVMRYEGGCLVLSPMRALGRGSRFRPTGSDTFEGLDGYYAGESLQVIHRPSGSSPHLSLATVVLAREPYGHDVIPS